MKIYVLTSVALLAEYGDLDSLYAPEVSTATFRTREAARALMQKELETEKDEAEALGLTDFRTELTATSATYEQGEPGNGQSWNRVDWTITETDAGDFPGGDRDIGETR